MLLICHQMDSFEERVGGHARHKRFGVVLDVPVLFTLGIQVWRIANLAIGPRSNFQTLPLWRSQRAPGGSFIRIVRVRIDAFFLFDLDCHVFDAKPLGEPPLNSGNNIS
jgi:hypothetical protein